MPPVPLNEIKTYGIEDYDRNLCNEWCDRPIGWQRCGTMEEVGVEPSSGHFETQACPFRPNLCSNDGISDGHSLNDHESRFKRQRRPYGRGRVNRRAVAVWLRGQHRDRERSCREGVNRHEAPTNVRTAPLPKLMTTGPLSLLRVSPSTRVVIEANFLL